MFALPALALAAAFGQFPADGPTPSAADPSTTSGAAPAASTRQQSSANANAPGQNSPLPSSTVASHEVSRPPTQSALEAHGFLEARGTATTPHLGELQLDPVLSATIGQRTFGMEARYEPRLFGRYESSGRSEFLALHRASLGFSVSPGNRFRFSSGVRGFYGRTDYSWLATLAENATPIFDLLPTSTQVRVVQLEPTMRLEQQIGRRWRWGLSGSFGVGGSDEKAFQSGLPPLQRTVRAAVDVGYTTRKDALSIVASGGRIRAADGQNSYFAAASVRLDHRFSRRLTGSVEGGALSQGAGQQWLPIASLQLRRVPVRIHREPTLTFGLRVVPVQDLTTGAIGVRPQGTTVVDQPVSRHVSVFGAGGLALPSLTQTSPLLWQGAVGARWTVNKDFQMSTGVRAASQPGVQVVGYVAFGADSRGTF